MANILDAFKENQEQETAVDTGKRIRVGIIGCGGIANRHMRTYKNQPDVDVVAGCDLVPGRAAAFMEKYGVTGVKTDYKNGLEMLADKSLALDAVSICTYNREHATNAIAALEAGVNVILEKPFTVTTEEAIAVMRAEKRSGKILSIGFQPRFDGNMQMIKRIVEAGTLGKIYYIQTGGGRRRGIPVGNEASFIRADTAGLGALADIGCYSLDMVLNAIGYPKPLTVTGYTSDFFGKDPQYFLNRKQSRFCADLFGVDDFAAGFIRLEGDVILDFRIAWAMNINTPGDTVILGTKGGLRIPSTNCWNGTIGGPMTLYHEVAGEQIETVIPPCPPKDAAGLWQGKIRSFLDAVKNGGTAPVPSSQILYNQAILDGIAKSAACGREITVEIPEI